MNSLNNTSTQSYQTVNAGGIDFKTYKDNLLGGGLSYLRTIERLYQPIATLNNVSLIPTSNTNCYFVLRFNTNEARNKYRDSVFSIGEGKIFEDIIFPEILAEYDIGNTSYLFIKISPFLNPAGLTDNAVFHGLSMDIQELINTKKIPYPSISEGPILTNKRPPITLKGITFLNSTAVESGLLVFKDTIDESEGIVIGSKTIRDAGMGYYILSYESSEQAKTDYNAFETLYNDKNKIVSIPKMVTIFEYNGLTHIGISVEEKVDKTKGLIDIEYQGFVVNPTVCLQQGQVKDSVAKIV
ncbi:hypothetical protein COY60_02235 [Candidatus Gracilibacteria bacterium CG_4_10_14_0_8_um_filter_38_28]|nr:MAG: hypothetical protein COY60_02235 [Candidatus Gracilibacteria bacterium CG_4_10_14_0_8_um_filter_38_28]